MRRQRSQEHSVLLSLSGLVVHSANFIPDDHRSWRQRSHSNPHWQLVLAKGRDLHFQKSEERLLLQNGHVLLLHPNELHRSWGSVPTESGFFYVQFSADGQASPRSDAIALPIYGKCTHPALFALFSELLDEMWHRPKYYRCHAAAIVTKLLVAIARETMPFRAGSSPLNVRSPHEAHVVSCVKAFLEAHFREDLSSEEIAKHAGYNYSYLSRQFSKATGMTITDYIHYLRVELARVLLLEMNPDGSIRDVAERVGYSDPSYFGRIFRRFEGVSPREYIKNAYGRSAAAHFAVK